MLDHALRTSFRQRGPVVSVLEARLALWMSSNSGPGTASFKDLRRRGLPEGVAICDVNVFAAVIEEAYHTPGALHMLSDLDEHGNGGR